MPADAMPEVEASAAAEKGQQDSTEAAKEQDDSASTQVSEAAAGESQSESGTSTPAPVASESRSDASAAEPAQAGEGGASAAEPPQEDFRSALADRNEQELKEMGRRLTSSREALGEALEAELAEQEALKEENEYLKKTIDFMFSELSKLNIGSSNLSDPQLAEGPLDFVGRYWEKVRPRNNTVVTSEHVGELDLAKKQQDVPHILQELTKKFRPAGEAGETGQEGEKGKRREELEELGRQAAERSQELGRQAAERGRLLGKQISEKVKLLSEKAEEGVAKLREEGAKLQMGSEKSDKSEKTEGEEVKAPDRANILKSLLAPEQAEARANALKGFGQNLKGFGQNLFGRGQKEEVSPTAAEAAKPKKSRSRREAQPSSEPAAEEPQEKASSSEASGSAAPAQAPAEAPEAAAPAAAAVAAVSEEAEDEEDGATVLLIAKLKLQDGNTVLCRVRAADRIKTVAKNFIKEHKLDPSLEDPLRKYLMNAESEAVSFPVHLEADLAELSGAEKL